MDRQIAGPHPEDSSGFPALGLPLWIDSQLFHDSNKLLGSGAIMKTEKSGIGMCESLLQAFVFVALKNLLHIVVLRNALNRRHSHRLRMSI